MKRPENCLKFLDNRRPVRGHCRTERRKDGWFSNPKGIVSSSPATESARLPWVGARAIFNPNGVVSQLRHRATTPLGLADTTRFSDGRRFERLVAIPRQSV